MMNSAKFTRVAAPAAGLVVCFVAADAQTRKQARLTAKSVYRIGNLLTTATVMCGDYGFHYAFRKQKTIDLLDQKQEELLAIQHNMEILNIELLSISSRSGGAKNREEQKLRQQIVNVRSQMDVISREITDLLEKGHCKKNPVHVRNARRMTEMCAQNGGLYIKLGQHIAMLDYIVPLEYREELSVLLGTTPHSSFESVCNVVEGELGHSPLLLFDEFEPIPIASASLAQVHRASRDGKQYAVKVQHEGLAESAHVDMMVITKLVEFVHKIFPEFDYEWLTKEMNVTLPQELNFHCEKSNIEKTANLLKSFIECGDVVVPTVDVELSGRTVLTMSFEEGCYVTNKNKMKEWNINTVQIAETISKVFCAQIFRHGFVHCGKISSLLAGITLLLRI